jgi:hypothetical protein
MNEIIAIRKQNGNAGTMHSLPEQENSMSNAQLLTQLVPTFTVPNPSGERRPRSSALEPNRNKRWYDP